MAAAFIRLDVCRRCGAQVALMRSAASGSIITCNAELLPLRRGRRIFDERGRCVYGRGDDDAVRGRELHWPYCRRPRMPLASAALAAVLGAIRKHWKPGAAPETAAEN